MTDANSRTGTPGGDLLTDEADTAADRPLEHLKVLLVEHDETEARRVTESLRAAPGLTAELFVEPSIDAAVKRSGGTRFDVVLLDIDVQNGAGLAGLDQLRKSTPSCPVVALTDGCDPELTQHVMERGARDCLVKGTESPRLGYAVRYAVAHQALADRLQHQSATLEAERARFDERVVARTTELVRLNRAHRALSAANHALARSKDEQEVLDAICSIIVELGSYRFAWVGYAESDEAKGVKPMAHAGGPADYLDAIEVHWADDRLGRGPTGVAVRSGETQVLRDMANDPSYRPWRDEAVRRGFAAAISLPLRDRDGVFGALNIYSADPDAFDTKEVGLLEELAADLSFGVSAARTRAQQEAAENSLREHRQSLQALVDTAPALIVLIDSAGRIRLFNSACEKLTGYPAETALGEKAMDLLVPQEWHERVRNEFGRTRKQLTSHVQEIPWRTSTGDERLIEWHSSPLPRPPAAPWILGIGIDVTERRQAEAQMRKLSSAIETAADLILITDAAGTIEYVNPAFERSTGFSAVEAIGRTPAILKSGLHDPAFYAELWNTISRGKQFQAVFTNRRKSGELSYVDLAITPLLGADGNTTHYIAAGRDITEERRAEERIRQLSAYDAVTNLPNRALFLERLQQATARPPDRSEGLAVLFLDLDRFKVVNETLGHDAGDELIAKVAERIAGCVRAGDTLARLGGDEFAILMCHIGSTEDVGPCADRILKAFHDPFLLLDEEVYISASIGISLFPRDGTDAGILLGRSEKAMYQAKDRGRNRARFYTADSHAVSFERLSLETSLRRALEREEFTLHYQPQVDLYSGVMLSLEALIRWQHPELGLVSPAEFIPLLEDTGLIVPVGEWVIRAAAAQHVEWRTQGLPPLEIAINLSPVQFQQETLVGSAERILQDTGMDPRYLELEITESTVMQRLRDTVKALREFKAMGIRLTVDDFGTGYSSLSYLTRLPIDILKVDRSFVRNVPDNEDDAKVAQAIIALSHSLRLTIVAEGVETHGQLDFLRTQGAHRAQGFLFSRPVPASNIPALVNKPLLSSPPA